MNLLGGHGRLYSFSPGVYTALAHMKVIVIIPAAGLGTHVGGLDH